MSVNKLGIGRIAFPQDTVLDLLMSLEEFNRKVDDNVNYLLRPNNRTISASGALTEVDSFALCSGTITLSLPQASTVTGKSFVIKNTGDGVITVDGNGSETIDGDTFVALSQKWQSIIVMSDGSNWLISARA